MAVAKFFALAYYLQHEEESKVGEMENEFRNSFLERYLEEHLMESLAMEANYAGMRREAGTYDTALYLCVKTV